MTGRLTLVRASVVLAVVVSRSGSRFLPIRIFSILAIVLAGSALDVVAHVTANPNEAAAGSYFRTAFRVSHGLDGSATVAVTIRIPEGVILVKPQPKPGWVITMTTRQLEQPIDAGHGTTIYETVDTVTWRGGPLPDAYFDEFGLSMKLLDEPAQILYFPTVQECESGAIEWVEIPSADQAWGQLPHPAPFVKVSGERSRHHHAK